MKIHAIVLAIDETDGLYKKNSLLIGKKPLIEYTLEAAINSELINKVSILTNAKEVIAKYKGNNDLNLFCAPKALTKDKCSLKNILLYLHKISNFSQSDILVLLPTICPLRTSRHIDNMVRFAKTLNFFDSIVSVTEERDVAQEVVLLSRDKKIKKMNKAIKKNYTSAQKLYRLNNAIFLVNPKVISRLSSFLISKKSYAFEMEYFESINVQTPADVALAQAVFKYQRERFSWKVRGGFNLQRLYIKDDTEMGISRTILDAAAYERHFQRYRFFLKHIKPSDRILDIACGSGYGSEILSSKAKFVYGIDADAETVKYAKRNHARPNIHFAVSPIGTFVPQKRFDKIISIETIEHLSDPERFLAGAKKWLKPGGVLWLSCPLSDESRQHIENPFHISQISRVKLRNIMNRHFTKVKFYNFSQDKIFSVDSLNNPTAYIVAKATTK